MEEEGGEHSWFELNLDYEVLSTFYQIFDIIMTTVTTANVIRY